MLIHWAPLNGITLGPRQTDPINRPILGYWFLTGLEYRYKNDPINRDPIKRDPIKRIPLYFENWDFANLLLLSARCGSHCHCCRLSSFFRSKINKYCSSVKRRWCCNKIVKLKLQNDRNIANNVMTSSLRLFLSS